MSWPAGEAAFVTGGASGIGYGIARALVASGAKVALADIDRERVQRAAEELAATGGKVVGVTLDVRDPAQWSAAADRAEEALGPISILVNNAGVPGLAPVDQLALEVWRWTYSINAEAQFIGVSTLLPRFKELGRPAYILNTASMAGLAPMVGTAAYASSKAASIAFTRVLRDELAGSGIAVSLLCPGTVATRLVEHAARAEAELLGTQVDEEVTRANVEMAAKGADPDRVGEQVVEAMAQRQFLIVTHRDWAPMVERWQAEVSQAFENFDDRHGSDLSAQMMVKGQVPVTL